MGWTLLAQTEVSQGAWIATLILALGGFLTAAVTAVNSYREKLSATKAAEKAAHLAEERQELDYLFLKNKEFLSEAREQFKVVQLEAREAAKKHIDCELRLARAEERLALLEQKESRREQAGA